MTSRERYLDYRDFLRDGGRAIEAAAPHAANMLRDRGFDPDVERLLEGIAFRAAAIETTLADRVPIVMQLLFDILFPHYLRPTPAAAIVQLNSEAPGVIPRGTSLASDAVNGLACRFRTSYDADVGPLHVSDATWSPQGDGGALCLRFAGRPPTPSDPDRLRLYLRSDEPLLATHLYRALLSEPEDAPPRVSWHGGHGRRAKASAAVTLRPVGLAPEEALLDDPDGSSGALRLFQEYFSLPQKFWFVDVVGAWGEARRLGLATSAEGWELRVACNTSLPGAISASNFLLGCTPMVNIFEHHADPVARGPFQTECRVRPAGPHHAVEIYRVSNVRGLSQRGSAGYPLLSDLMALDDQTQRCAYAYRTRVRPRRQRDGGERADSGQEPAWATFVSLFDADPAHRPIDQTVLIDVLATDGNRPTALRADAIRAGPAWPARVVYRMVTEMTASAPAPTGEDLRRRLVKHLALAQRGVRTTIGLHDAIDLYNFAATVDARAARTHDTLLTALGSVKSRVANVRHHGDPVRGLRTQVTFGDSAIDDGELFVLGGIINEVVATAVPVNVFSQLELQGFKRRRTYVWPKRLGPERMSG